MSCYGTTSKGLTLLRMKHMLKHKVIYLNEPHPNGWATDRELSTSLLHSANIITKRTNKESRSLHLFHCWFVPNLHRNTEFPQLWTLRVMGDAGGGILLTPAFRTLRLQLLLCWEQGKSRLWPLPPVSREQWAWWAPSPSCAQPLLPSSFARSLIPLLWAWQLHI